MDPQIVFGLRGFPDFGLDSVNEHWIRVPLTWTLALQSAEDDRLRGGWADLTLAEHSQLHAALQHEWSRFQQYTSCPEQNGRFEFEYWQTHLLYVRKIVRRLLDEFKPVGVAYPRREQDRFAECGNDEERLRWLVLTVIAEETEALPNRLFVDSTPPSAAQGGGFRSAIRHWRSKIAGTRVRVAENRTKRALREPRARLGRRQTPRVLVVAQRAKATEIFKIASQRRYLTFVPYEHIEALYPPTADQVPNDLSWPADSAQWQLWHWLHGRLSVGSASSELERDVLTNPPKALITDARHDPRIQNLIRACIQADVQVAIIPEGAAVGVDEHAAFWESLRLILPEVTYFLLTAKEEQLYVQLGASPDLTHVTGYLGDTLFPSKKRALLGALTEFRARRLVRRSSRAHGMVVGVTLDILGSARAMSIPGAPPALQSLAAYKDVLTQLSSAGFLVVVAVRDPAVATLFRKHFALPNVVYLSRTPWQWTARHSRAMVSWLSSVAWECGVLGVPVVIPRFGDVPSIAEVTLRGEGFHRASVSYSPLQLVADVEAAAGHSSSVSRRGAGVGACGRTLVSQWLERAIASETGPDRTQV